MLTYHNCSIEDVCAGWHSLINDLVERLDSLESMVYVVQVKEKFGGLRFYVDVEPSNDKDFDIVHNLIKVAEEKSYTICEFCGAPGSTENSKGYWIKTVCLQCN